MAIDTPPCRVAAARLARVHRAIQLPFFHNANWDALVECLPTCVERGASPRYPPVRAGTHLMAKFRSTVT